MKGFDKSKINIKSVKEPSLEEKMTGEVIVGLGDKSKIEPNAELEGKEHIQFPDGTVQKVVGEPHSKGGVKMNIPDGTRVLSDNLTLTSTDTKVLEKEFGLKLSTKDTYSSALEKFNTKIGLKKLHDEQEDLFKEVIRLGTKGVEEGTSRINSQYLSSKIKQIEDQKIEKERVRNMFFDAAFRMQEKYKEVNKKENPEESKFKYGGISMQTLEKLAEKHNISKEKALSLVGGKIPTFEDGGKYTELASKDKVTTEEIQAAYKNGLLTKEEADKLEARVVDRTTPTQSTGATPTDYMYSTQLPAGFEGKVRGVQAIAEFLNSYSETPSYKYSEVAEKGKEPLWNYVQMWGVEGVTKEDIDNADKNKLDEIAGKLQQTVLDKEPELALDYGLMVAPTKKGLQWLADNKVIDPSKYPTLFKDGQPLRGSFENPEARATFREIVKNIPQDKMQDYAESNFKDNQWYFRSLAKQTVDFTNEEDYKNWQKENEANRIGNTNFYRTDKGGAYVRPLLYKEREFASKEEADKWIADRKLDTNYGAFYNSDDPSIFERPNYPGQVEEPPVTEPGLREQPIVDDIITVGGKRYPRLFAMPDQTPLAPSPMDAHMMGETRLGRIDPIRVGIEPQKQLSDENLQFYTEQLDALPPAARASAIANLQLNASRAVNEEIYKANTTNASNIASAELFNIGQADREQEANLRNKLSFEARQFTAKAKTEEELRNYFDQLRRINVNNFKNQQMLNLMETMTPNARLNYNGMGVEYVPDGYTLQNPNINYNLVTKRIEEEDKKKKSTAKKDNPNTFTN